MPTLAQGQSVDVSVTVDSTLTVMNPAQYATVENPVGTVIYGGGEASAKIDVKSGTVRITAVTGGLYYELQTDPSVPNYVTQDSDGNVHATIIPRTNTLTNLKALMTGGGELASATDTPCIVQLNGTPGSGTAAVYSPMGAGFWADSVGARGDQQLQAKTGTGVSGNTGGGRNLLLSGGAGSATGTNKASGKVIITGGLSPTAGQGAGASLIAGQNTGPVGLAGSDGTNVIYVDIDDLLYVSPDVFPDSDPGAEGALYKTVISGVTVLAVSQG